MGGGEGLEELLGFLFGHHHRDAPGMGSPQGIDVVQLFGEDMLVKKEDGAQGLVLGGGGHLLFNGQMGEEGFDFRFGHLVGMPFVMEEDVAFDPGEVAFFGAVGIMV